ncbi:nucleotide sugar dehydrogenase [Moritella sp. 28]|uniref:nucleotide sugar dehydrogenase n=1 Tax=Moritella sp. 28 TaxID=2746232 RepID=UPI001BA6CA2F|nr:nucleotide sugar dehydrogenase [Moritella sp. 28]QUM83586.1 nucleotide sugar dehydrogenase [Moritella sp. 28]
MKQVIDIDNGNINIGIIGLGYVGLPLAVEFGKKYKTIGFDVVTSRIEELKTGFDANLETSKDDLVAAKQLTLTGELKELADCDFYIVTVPTPVDGHYTPDLTALRSASKSIAMHLSKGNIVIFESTVYPGATEEDCVPILEQYSGLKFNKDFFCGYSPERINPGDKNNDLTSIMKVTSGSTNESGIVVDHLYKAIIKAGTYLAPSIQVAEAAKVIENTQRDVNIALMNELSVLFHALNIDTNEVLKAAGTKWNFLPFKPGLVGGHCIGVDPYYLVHKSKSIGYTPELIMAGRKLNDTMADYIFNQILKTFSLKGKLILNSEILVLGSTFKENCPDTRNSKVPEVVNKLAEFGANISIYDPWINKEKYQDSCSQYLVDEPELGIYNAIIIAVAHDEFIEMGASEIKKFGIENTLIFDLKNIMPVTDSDWRL